jgi:hypothetical protein
VPVPAKVPVVQAPKGPGLAAKLKELTKNQETPPYALWGGAAVVVVAAIAAIVYFATRGPVPTGTLVIDAAPWATVTAIQTESGRAQPLPSPASTPLSISLPAGTYQITLTGPDSKVTTVTARVDVGGVAVAPPARFQTVTVEEYFEQYLAAGSAAGGAAAAQPDPPGAPASATPSSAPAPTSGGNQ